jgi:hypothetical protein
MKNIMERKVLEKTNEVITKLEKTQEKVAKKMYIE